MSAHLQGVKPRKEVPIELSALANDQGGCLTRQQCLDAGLGPEPLRRLLKDDWAVTAPGVYCLGKPDWHATLWTASLACGDEAVIGAHAAAHLDGLVDLPPARILVWTGRHWVKGPPTAVTARRASRRGHGSPRRTWPEDTVLDLAGEGADQAEVIQVIGRTFATGLTTPGRLLDVMDKRSRQSHRQLIVQLCGDLRGVDSPLELRFVNQVQRPHGLPVPERQARYGPGRYDNLFREQGVIVELDGTAHHRGRRFRDMRRDNASLVQLGFVTLRYGWQDVVNRSCAVAAEIAHVLQERGWRGQPVPCRNCRGGVGPCAG